MHKLLFYQARKIALKWLDYFIEIEADSAHFNLTKNKASINLTTKTLNKEIDLSVSEALLLLDYFEFLINQHRDRTIFYHHHHRTYQLTFDFFVAAQEISVLLKIKPAPFSKLIQIDMSLLPYQRELIKQAVQKKSAITVVESALLEAIGLAELILEQWKTDDLSYLVIVDQPYFASHHPQTLLINQAGYDLEKALLSAAKFDLDALLIINNLSDLSIDSYHLISRLASNKNLVLITEKLDNNYNFNHDNNYNLNLKIIKQPQLCLCCKKPISKLKPETLKFQPILFDKNLKTKKFLYTYQAPGCQTCGYSGFLGHCFLITSQDHNHQISLDDLKLIKALQGFIPIEN